jgi:hypothetical protein
MHRRTYMRMRDYLISVQGCMADHWILGCVAEAHGGVVSACVVVQVSSLRSENG